MVGSKKMAEWIIVAGVSLAVFAVWLWARSTKQPSPYFDIGSPIGSARVIYNSTEISMDTKKIADLINQDSKNIIAKAEDVRLPNEVFPLVRVKAPVSFVVVINDHPDAATEIQELADEAEKDNLLPKDLISKLRKCNASIDLSSANSPVTITNNAIVVGGKTDLDPSNPPVLRVIRAIETATHGLSFNCVDGKWLTK